MSADLQFNNRMLLQTFNENKSYEIKYVKNVKEIERLFENKIPYSALINIYYICSHKGGGADKKNHKKHIHRKYIALLQKIRIFDENNKQLMDNEEYFNNLVKG